MSPLCQMGFSEVLAVESRLQRVITPRPTAASAPPRSACGGGCSRSAGAAATGAICKPWLIWEVRTSGQLEVWASTPVLAGRSPSSRPPPRR